MQLNKCCRKLFLICEAILGLIVILLLIYSIDEANFPKIIIIICYIIIHIILLIYIIIEAKKNNVKENSIKNNNEEIIVNTFSTISHELRTPLTSIIGFSKLIKKKLTSIKGIYESNIDILQQDILKNNEFSIEYKKFVNNIKKIEGYIDIIISEGDRLTSIINNFLDFSKLESGNIELNKEEVGIQELISKAMLMFYSIVETNNIILTDEVEENLPNVYCDKDKTFQVIVNLIANAIKFTEKGFVCCKAKLHNANEILIEIEDSGIGIAKEHYTKIFKSFTQIKNRSFETNGTGLGLTICKKIIEAHGGKIWVDSIEGVGSKFFFKIPIK